MLRTIPYAFGTKTYLKNIANRKSVGITTKLALTSGLRMPTTENKQRRKPTLTDIYNQPPQLNYQLWQ